MKKLITVLILSMTISTVYTQYNVYYTRNAILQVNGEFENELLLGQSKELRISLDYETTEIVIRFHPNDLKFNIDTLNQILESEFEEVIFKGRLSLDHINTTGHPPQKFVVEGKLEVNGNTSQVAGKGELHHITDSGEFSCMLGMTVLLNLNDLGLETPAGLFKEIEIVITQALLRTDKN
jgi:hypothetical protein